MLIDWAFSWRRSSGRPSSTWLDHTDPTLEYLWLMHFLWHNIIHSGEQLLQPQRLRVSDLFYSDSNCYFMMIKTLTGQMFLLYNHRFWVQQAYYDRHHMYFYYSLNKCHSATSSFLKLPDIVLDFFPLQCFDTVGWATGRASGL